MKEALRGTRVSKLALHLTLSAQKRGQNPTSFYERTLSPSIRGWERVPYAMHCHYKTVCIPDETPRSTYLISKRSLQLVLSMREPLFKCNIERLISSRQLEEYPNL